MSSIDYKQDLKFLTIQNLTLKQMGIDINTLKRRELLKNFWKFIFLISCTVYLEYGLINFVVHNVSNIDVATGALSMLNQGFLILIKMSVFLAKGDKFMKLIWDMNLLAEKGEQNKCC